MFSLIILAVFLLLIISHYKPEPILGVYQQGGPLAGLKQVLMFLLIKLNKRRVQHRPVGHSQAWLGLAAEDDITVMESPQKLVSHSLACDAVWFGGGSRDGTYLVISGARRQNNILESMVFLYLPGVGLLEHHQHPDTAMTQSESQSDRWEGGGVSLTPVSAMKVWRVGFQGRMRSRETGCLHTVKIEGEFRSDLPYFDFDSDMEVWTVARAMAREPWSREYFARLKSSHQNHYEQFGNITGSVEVDGSVSSIAVEVMRDHTHGSIRDWRLLHRYCFHQFCTASELRGFLGVVSQPGTLSLIEMGWIYNKGRKMPVEVCQLQPWNLGEGGQDPADYGFRFKAGGEWFNVEVTLQTQERGEAFFGNDWESRVVERFCNYKINGEKGWGVSEWQYRNKAGKTGEISHH